MLVNVVICAVCDRILAVGAALPAVCVAGVPEAERRSLGPFGLDSHPKAHLQCSEIMLDLPEELEGEALLSEASARYVEARAAARSVG